MKIHLTHRLQGFLYTYLKLEVFTPSANNFTPQMVFISVLAKHHERVTIQKFIDIGTVYSFMTKKNEKKKGKNPGQHITLLCWYYAEAGTLFLKSSYTVTLG